MLIENNTENQKNSVKDVIMLVKMMGENTHTYSKTSLL